ncbi:MAG TPA: putative Ig domain-containing protein, partial [Patescibacteria group bacterium]|nr:putative Ig domain-containing protein [Patescibacteria group bacterium]
MSVSVAANSVVSTGGKQVALSSLFTVTAATTDPTYLIVSGLDRDEYTAGYSTAAMGSLSGNGASQGFSNIGSDAYSVGAVFTYQAATGRYYSSTYGYFDQLTYKTSTSTNDNVSLSVFTTNNASLATTYATNPYVLVENPTYFTDVGSVSVVTQPSVTGPALTQATPSSVTAAAMSFVGKAWNNEGCWVLASNIAAEAGASLPLTSTLIGIGGVANGEWIVAYNGPVAANSNWQSLVHAGEIIAFAPTANSGHITTCVSGSGSTAMLVDNITYINGNGSIANSANDGSAADIVVATPHAASQEFANAAANSVVIYELDTPVVSDVVSSITVALKGSQSLASAFTVSNPLASQAITEYQLYDTAGSDSFSVSGVAKSANSAAAALTVGSLSGVCLTAGATACSDTVEVRAYNGSYWGDWQSLAVTVAGAATPAAAPPKVNAQTANQNWVQGQVVNFTLPANTFIDPQSQKLTYSASLSNGTALPGWLTFNAATDSFSGTVTGGLQTLAVKLTATDTSGLSTFETFNIAIPAAPPVVSAATPNLTFQQGQLFCLTLPANTFTDPQGQKLTYSASLSNGAALPSWMLFNSVTATVIGVIPSGIQTYAIKLTATDTSGLSASESFTVTIPAAAPMVTAVTANQTWQQGAKVSFTLAANTFTDPQGQKLTLSASQSSGAALPSWLTFNAATGTFSGTVTGGAQSLSLTVKAADTSGLSVSEAFGVTVPSAAPTVTAATANQTWQQGAKVSFTLAANT